MDTDKLIIGQNVDYVLGNEWNNAGEVRAAIIVRVWSPISVNLLVFLDGDNDKRVGADGWETVPGYVLWKTSVTFNEDELPGTWNYGKSILEPYES